MRLPGVEDLKEDVHDLSDMLEAEAKVFLDEAEALSQKVNDLVISEMGVLLG